LKRLAFAIQTRELKTQELQLIVLVFLNGNFLTWHYLLQPAMKIK
jgi:hypothetical protein